MLLGMSVGGSRRLDCSGVCARLLRMVAVMGVLVVVLDFGFGVGIDVRVSEGRSSGCAAF